MARRVFKYSGFSASTGRPHAFEADIYEKLRLVYKTHCPRGTEWTHRRTLWKTHRIPSGLGYMATSQKSSSQTNESTKSARQDCILEEEKMNLSDLFNFCPSLPSSLNTSVQTPFGSSKLETCSNHKFPFPHLTLLSLSYLFFFSFCAF